MQELKPLQTLRTGQRVHVAGPPGSCWADVLRAATPADLPAIDGAPPPAIVTAILQERGAEQLALIGWKHSGRKRCCWIVGDGRGGWEDLQGQHLTIREETTP